MSPPPNAALMASNRKFPHMFMKYAQASGRSSRCIERRWMSASLTAAMIMWERCLMCMLSTPGALKAGREQDRSEMAQCAGMRVLNPNWRYWPSLLDVYPNMRLIAQIKVPVLVMHVRLPSILMQSCSMDYVYFRGCVRQHSQSWHPASEAL